jgi:hypothetical protein
MAISGHNQANPWEGVRKMYVLMRYRVGVVVEGVVLAHRKNRMRIAVAGFADTLELQRSGAQWFAGPEPVEIDFLMSNSYQSPLAEESKPVRKLRFAYAN